MIQFLLDDILAFHQMLGDTLVSDHFPQVGKMIEAGKGVEREIDDYN